MGEVFLSKLYVENDNIEWENVGEGVQRKILGYDDEIMMVLVKFDKGGIGTLHSHRHRQVSYVARGKFEVQIEQNKKVLKEGDCFYLPPHLEHGALCLEEGILVDVFNPQREDFLDHIKG